MGAGQANGSMGSGGHVRLQLMAPLILWGVTISIAV